MGNKKNKNKMMSSKLINKTKHKTNITITYKYRYMNRYKYI